MKEAVWCRLLGKYSPGKSSSQFCCVGKVEYQEEDREAERWMCGIRLAAGLLGGAGQKQFTQNMVKIFNERNTTNI